MRSASEQHSSYLGRSSPRRRAVSLLLALALVALVIALLIRLGVLPAELTETQPSLSTFDVRPGKQVAATRPLAAAKAPVAHAAPPPPRPKPVVPPTPRTTAAPTPKLLALSKDEFAATDIGKIKGSADAAAEGEDSGKDSAAAYGPGEGPGGARLYNAQWYREPTHAQLAFYLPPGTPSGIAMIACRTVPNYQVEDCRELGETPPGGGLAHAMTRAAWQFRVRPPRLGGKPLIGAWVRIRIDLKRTGPDETTAPD